MNITQIAKKKSTQDGEHLYLLIIVNYLNMVVYHFTKGLNPIIIYHPIILNSIILMHPIRHHQQLHLPLITIQVAVQTPATGRQHPARKVKEAVGSVTEQKNVILATEPEEWQTDSVFWDIMNVLIVKMDYAAIVMVLACNKTQELKQTGVCKHPC